MLSWTRAEQPEIAYAAVALPATSTSLDGNEDSPALPAPGHSPRRLARRVRRRRLLDQCARERHRHRRRHTDHEGELHLAADRRLLALQGSGPALPEGGHP